MQRSAPVSCTDLIIYIVLTYSDYARVICALYTFRSDPIQLECSDYRKFRRPWPTISTVHRHHFQPDGIVSWWCKADDFVEIVTPLREITCHMWSHSVTCHPAAVTFPPLPQWAQPKLVLDLATLEGCKAELTSVVVISEDSLLAKDGHLSQK